MTKPLTKDELYHKDHGLCTIISQCAAELGLEIQEVGGIRRGEYNSHDLDFILRHKDGKIDIFDLTTKRTALQQLIVRLKEYTVNGTPTCEMSFGDVRPSAGNMEATNRGKTLSKDHYEGRNTEEKQIDSLPEHDVIHICVNSRELELAAADAMDTEGAHPPATMRRVDLVLVPADQWPFVLWGWTGSTMLQRQSKCLPFIRDLLSRPSVCVSLSVATSLSCFLTCGRGACCSA